MKKHILALIAVIFLLQLSLVAYADVLIEPENDFYNRHRGQILSLGRRFSANGAGGSAAVKKEPGAKNDIAKLQNGEATHISFSCLYDGDYWGFTFEYSGWIKMEQLLVLYDYVAFAEEHLDEFYAYSGDYAKIKQTSSAIAWSWPGADGPVWTFEDLNAEHFFASYAYKDEESREWGFISYLFGSRNIWVCLSDPLNRDIPAFNPAPEPMAWVSDTVHTEIEASGDVDSMLVILVVLVAVLVIGTAVLIKVFWKPRKTETGGTDDE